MRVGLVISCCAGLASAASAQDGRWRGELWTGWGQAAMQSANDDRRHAFDDALPSVGAKDPGLTWDAGRLGGGLVIGVEGSYVLADEWLVGARAGFVSAGNSLHTFTYATQYASSGGAFSSREVYRDELSASLVPLLVGGRFENIVSPAVSVLTGVFAGLGIASGSAKFSHVYTATGTGPYAAATSSTTSAYTTGLSGLGFGGEFLVGMNWKIVSGVSLGFDLGYRLLRVPVTAAKAVDVDGDGVVDAKRSYTLDFSGHLLTVTLGYAY